jgi:hypothetical protein
MLDVENIYKTSYWKGWRHVDKQFHAVRISQLSVKACTSENEAHLVCVHWRSLKGQGWFCNGFLSHLPLNTKLGWAHSNVYITVFLLLLTCWWTSQPVRPFTARLRTKAAACIHSIK